MPMKRAPRRQTRRRGPRERSTRRRNVAEIAGLQVQQIETIRGEIEQLAERGAPPRWNANPDDVRRSVAKLVLTLVEFIRQLLERHMETGTLTAQETEAIGLALMRLEETVRDLGAQFDLSAEDLNLNLGPIGKLM
jgi:hypothetical protein